jgi:hypothetical protein
MGQGPLWAAAIPAFLYIRDCRLIDLSQTYDQSISRGTPMSLNMAAVRLNEVGSKVWSLPSGDETHITIPFRARVNRTL